jgi:hypothetical protein
MDKENYVGQVFGTRQIIRNECTEDELVGFFGRLPKEPHKYRMARCIACGN